MARNNRGFLYLDAERLAGEIEEQIDRCRGPEY
jgi:hypothetical protein